MIFFFFINIALHNSAIKNEYSYIYFIFPLRKYCATRYTEFTVAH